MSEAKPLPQDLPILRFEDAAGFCQWLDENHRVAKGLWLEIGKKNSGVRTVSYLEAVDVALCFGWIDGQSRSLSDSTYIQRFVPRRKQSVWSKINREKALALIDCGKMRPAGLEEIERAKADGRWDAAYDSMSSVTVPEDLQFALDANPTAKAFFESLSSTNRYAVLWRIQTARRPETRAKRISDLTAMLAREEKFH